MADESWIKVYRKIKKSFVWSNPYQLKLWLLILSKAQFKPEKFVFNGKEIVLNSGQLVTGRTAITAEMNEGVKSSQQVNSSSVWNWLSAFKNNGLIDIKSNNKYSVITVLNWGRYQQNEQQPDSNLTSTEHQLDTFKELKNEKNDKNISTTTRDTVFDFYQQNGFGPISGFIAQDLDMWRDDFVQIGADKSTAEQILIKALGIAAERNSRSWGYAKAILKSWHNANLNTIEKIDAEQAAFKAKKPAANSSKSKGVYKEREMTDEDLKWPEPKE